MLPKLAALIFAFALTVSIARAADIAPARANLSAAEIVNKNVEARGGLQAWRAVQTMSMEGRLGVGGNQRTTLSEPLPGKPLAKIPTDLRPKEEVQLPFSIEVKRPGKQRIELLFNGKKALQVFDGVNGWKLRPFLNRIEIEPFTADELKAASMQADLDGYLVDYSSKGTRVDLDGTEKVEDHDTYRLKLTLKSGKEVHVWIDAQTFLEAKIEGLPRKLDGIEHPVEVYYRDYRPVSGLQIPFVLETRVLPLANPVKGFRDTPVPAERITIQKVLVNPKLDESSFSKPEIATASKGH